MSENFPYPPVTDYLKTAAVPAAREANYTINVLLFLATILTTLFWGAFMSLEMANPTKEFGLMEYVRLVIEQPTILYRGVGYSFAILSILLAHEMGHYIACCYYGIQATLPFFIPAPAITGTFGAFIRIRSPFPNRKSLFDVGLAGPVAGFVMAIPFLYFGLKWSMVVPKGPDQLYMGEPLIFKLFASKLMPDIPGKDYWLHPVGFAAWFACLATSLNLLPIGQLDGGHVSYALFRDKAFYITWIFFAVVLGLAAYGFTMSRVSGFQWLVFAILLLVLKKIAGFRHPQTLNDDEPLDFSRKVWGVIALIIFILTFMPVTIFV